MKRWLFLGIVLIVVGLGFFVLNFLGIEARLLSPGPLFLGAIGAGLLVAYVYTRAYGLLIAGCVLSSLWLGTTVEELVPVWPGDLDASVILVSLGASFFAIYAVDRLYANQKRIWPVWPGLGLLLLSIVVAISGFVPESFVGTLFIAAPGLALLVIYLWRRSYPFLIPACILIALSLVIPAVDALSDGTMQQGMLAAGLMMGAMGFAFLAIYVADKLYTRASNWWPLIPGLVLLAMGGFFGLTGLGMGPTIQQLKALGEAWSRLWPLAVIAFGGWLIFRWTRRGRRKTTDTTPAEHD